MNVPTACRCIITLSLFGIAVLTQAPAPAASRSDSQPASSKHQEPRKPVTPEATNGERTMSGTPPVGKKEAPTPPNPAQQVEERVRSGQMEQPIAQGAISERLNQLESGSHGSSDHTATSR